VGGQHGIRLPPGHLLDADDHGVGHDRDEAVDVRAQVDLDLKSR
jgi:hypothetical protein